MYIISVLLYECQTLSIQAHNMVEMQNSSRRYLRTIIRVLWDDSLVSNTEVKHMVFCNNDKFFNEAVNFHQTPMTTES